jgi:hypothetical protein
MRLPRFLMRTRPRPAVYIEPTHQRKEREWLSSDIARAEKLMTLLAVPVDTSRKCPFCSQRHLLPDMDIDAIVQSLQQHIADLGDVANAQQYRQLVAIRFRAIVSLQGWDVYPPKLRKGDRKALGDMVETVEGHLMRVGIRFRS